MSLEDIVQFCFALTNLNQTELAQNLAGNIRHWELHGLNPILRYRSSRIENGTQAVQVKSKNLNR